MPVVRHRLPSKVLAGNPLGDPTERDLYVYLPPNYNETERYPAVLAIVGYTGSFDANGDGMVSDEEESDWMRHVQ